ncbi:MAG: preprotein translocase subunit SecE [Chloroflexi bacterium]|nr:MAG: preprotein translocase subunit SecE [Chloroflexota bacterium]TMF06747.1 MAG: preprotein translocase subunit SecE [Chloroflexota bacterium]
MAVTAKNRAGGGGDSATSGAGSGRFLREVLDELRKVVWPTWGELYRYTLVVIVTVAILGVFIGGVDYGISEILRRWLYVQH